MCPRDVREPRRQANWRGASHPSDRGEECARRCKAADCARRRAWTRPQPAATLHTGSACRRALSASLPWKGTPFLLPLLFCPTQRQQASGGHPHRPAFPTKRCWLPLFLVASNHHLTENVIRTVTLTAPVPPHQLTEKLKRGLFVALVFRISVKQKVHASSPGDCSGLTMPRTSLMPSLPGPQDYKAYPKS